MKKDKRGLALITAIAVLALMLILFGGLTMVYSAQVSRGKAELEQSQAMLIAQSYAEMLDQVLTSSNGEADGLKEKLGEIKTGSQVEIKNSLDNQPDDVIDSQVKIIATAEKLSISGNTTTRKIKIKVSATVDNETRSIDLDYTYIYSINSLNLQNYAVYGNQINSYDSEKDVKDDKNGKKINFENKWYDDDGDEVNLDEDYDKDDLYRLGFDEDGNLLFKIEKEEDTMPDNMTDENMNELLNDFASAKNGDGEPVVLQPWKNLNQPSGDIPYCSELNKNKSNKIKTSCIWDLPHDNGVTKVTAEDKDIIIYLPISDVSPLGNNFKIEFDGGGHNLFFYAYGEGELEIGSKAEIEPKHDVDMTDIYFISNDAIDIKINNKDAKELEAYFYFPKGTVIIDGSDDRIKGSLIADRIALVENNRKFKMEYIKPKKEVLENAGLGDSESSGSGSAVISYILNSYEEGGRS